MRQTLRSSRLLELGLRNAPAMVLCLAFLLAAYSLAACHAVVLTAQRRFPSLQPQVFTASPRIAFSEVPTQKTFNTTAFFRFGVVDPRGALVCSSCSVLCKLDSHPRQACNSGMISYSSLSEGEHKFAISVDSQNATALISNEYIWLIDATAPTATVSAGPAFTSATNLSVDIELTEPCPGQGGFKCATISTCDLLVIGAGEVMPSTLVVLRPYLEYRIVVELSQYLTGRVVLLLSNHFCSDSSGNKFERTNNSEAIVHIDRRTLLVNLWSSIPEKLVQINSVDRSVQATNSTLFVKIYLDFSIPVANSSNELLNSLQTSKGSLALTHRNSRGNRRFGYLLEGVSNVTVVTVTLNSNAIVSRAGTPLSSESSITSVSFLYDSVRPGVKLSTSSPLNGNDATVAVTVIFTEPVFLFRSSGVLVSGGLLKSFQETSERSYVLSILSYEEILSVSIPENSATDIAGNSNVASNLLQVRHYSVPSVSIVLYSFTAAAMVATSFTAGALCVSAASLVAAGAMSSQTAHFIYNDPARNLLGMASHLQVFALSDWLAVSLPVEYQETARGLQWLIPRLNFPWEKKQQNSGLPKAVLILSSAMVKKRGLASTHDDQEDRVSWTYQKRKLGANASIFGPPLSPLEYVTLFEVQGGKPLAANAFKNNNYSGWKDFEKNMLGLGIFGGGLLIIHVLTYLLYKWRMEHLQGAILLPRFELFLLILAVPCICQASAFLLRGGTRTGIIVGVLLLSIPAAFVLSVLLFISVAVLLGALVLFKESRHDEGLSGYKDVWNFIAGSNASGEWVLKEGLAQSFLARFGLLFEDRKGPPKLQNREGHTRNKSKSLDGTKSVRSSYSDDETEANSVPTPRKIFGAFRSGYIVVDLSRRVILGTAFGLFAISESSRSQVWLVLSITIVQLLYLAICKPYISKVVQIVESVSLICEASIFGSALALLHRENAVHGQIGVASFMLSCFLISFLLQVGNEWYALVKQLMTFAPREETGSLGPPLKMVIFGLAIPFLPRRFWRKLLPPTPELIRKGSKPIESPEEVAGAGIEDGGPSAEAQASESGNGEEEERGSMSEIRLEVSRKGKAPVDNRRQSKSPLDAGPSSSSTKELKLLQELARASFRSVAMEEDGESTGLGLEVSPEISPSRAAAVMASTFSSPFPYPRAPTPLGVL